MFHPGEPFRVVIHYRCKKDCEHPVFGVGLYRSDGTYINGSNHHWREDPIHLERVEAGERGEVEMDFRGLPLLKGQYYLTVFVYDHTKASPTAIDHREHAVTFEVIDARHLQHGMLFLPTRWTVRRTRGADATVTEVSES